MARDPYCLEILTRLRRRTDELEVEYESGRQQMIQIKYVGKSDIFGMDNGTILRVEEGTTISDVLDTAKVQKTFHKLVVPQVNGEHQNLTYVLQADDELGFFLPIGGG